MVKVNSSRLLYIGQALQRASVVLEHRAGLHDNLTREDHAALAEILSGIESDLKSLELDHSVSSVEFWRRKLQHGEPKSCIEAQYAFDEINRSISKEISKPIIVLLKTHLTRDFDALTASAVEAEVTSKFPSSWEDLWWAAHCYRMESFTAAIFHSMRAVEHVLCNVAKNLGVPCEFEQWHNIIEGIESAIKDLNKLPKGHQKAEDQEFYSSLAKEFRYFKDAWRNHVSHSRKTYDENKAREVCFHARDFIINAAVRLQE